MGDHLQATLRGGLSLVVAASFAGVLGFEASAAAAPPRKKRAPAAEKRAPANPERPPSSGQQALSSLNQGKKLMAAGQYAQACTKIAESQSLAPEPTTLLQLALCHEKEGKIATAQNEFTTVIMQSTTPNSPTAKTAKQHADALLPKLPRLTIKVPAGSESRGLQVTLDGLPVASSSWGIANPIDPGPHQIAATAKGTPPWSTTVNVTAPGEEKVVEVPGARVVDQLPPSESTPENTAKLENPFEGDAPAPPKEQAEPPQASRPALGYVIFGVGVVGTGVGTYYGLRAISLRKDSDAQCASGCNAQGVDLNNQAKTAAWISNFGIGFGLVGLAVGGYMLLKSPDAPAPREDKTETSLRIVPELSPTKAALSIGGTW